MLVNVHNQGIGFARPLDFHQSLILNLSYNLSDECYNNNWFVLPEPAITSNLNDKAPDVCVKRGKDDPILAIELCKHRNLKYDMNKCEGLVARFPDLDCFICDYEQCVMYYLSSKSEDWIYTDCGGLYSRYFNNPIEQYFIIPQCKYMLTERQMNISDILDVTQSYLMR